MKLPVATLLLLVAVSPLPAYGDDPRDRPEEIRIAVYSDVGVGRSVGNLLSVLERADRLHVEKVAAEEVRNGALDGFAVLIHPGGSGSKQGKQLGEEGREAVRSFVRRGGGFLGICAGAYLASADYVLLGAYETEIAKNGAPSGVMIGTTAIAAGTFGRGKVVCFSPHPEKTDGLGSFVHRAIEHVTGASLAGDVSNAPRHDEPPAPLPPNRPLSR